MFGDLERKKTEKRKAVLTGLVMLISFLLPFMSNYIVLLINCYGLSLDNLVLFMNDEVYWHAQTAGAVKYGMPLGYFGYNGSYAEIGTYNTWGPFPFIPYIILGRIFGYGIYSRHIFNILFMGIAIVIFFLLIKADIKKMLLTDTILFLMPLNIAYLLTAMSEPERFAVALILAGMFIRSNRPETGKIFKYAVFPIVLVLSCYIYYLFLVFIPLYIFMILKDKKLYLKTAATAGAGLVIAVPLFYLNGKMSAPYNLPSGLSETVNLIRSYLDLSNGILFSVKGILAAICSNLAHFGPRNLVNIFSMERGFYSVYIAVYELILSVLLVSVFLCRKDRGLTINNLAVTYVMAVFLMAFALLYAEDPLTVVRGLNCALIFAAAYYIGEDMYTKLNIFYTIAYILFLTVVFIFGVAFIERFCVSGHEAAEKTERIMEERNVIQQYMQADPDALNWENTIGYYGELGTEYLEIPDGFGLNYMTENKIDDKMGWVVINKKDMDTAEKLRKSMQDQFLNIYENDDFYILQNKEKSETSK